MWFTKAIAALAGLAVLGAGPRQPAAQAIEWRMDVSVVQTRPEAKYVAQFADRVNENAKGRLKINVYYGGSLGIGQADALRSLKAGSVEMAMLYAGYFGRDAPDLALAIVQGVVLTPQEGRKIVAPLTEIYREYYESWNTRVVGWVSAQIYDISVFCKQPVNTLADLKGKKLRVWSKDQVDAFTRLGVSAQIIGQNDLYIALQTGVVDCALYVAAIAKTISLQEVTKHAAYLHTYSPLPSAIGVSRRAWDKLPADLQAVVLEAGDWIYRKALDNILDSGDEEKARQEFTQSGAVKFLEPFPLADRKALYEAASEVWKQSAEKVGRRAPQYYRTISSALEKIRQGQ
jgi:TRAP-type transport system periplasmic protein